MYSNIRYSTIPYAEIHYKTEDKMPKPPIIPREEILNVAYRIVKTQGVEAATADAIAAQMGCSIRPIYYVYSTMDNLREAVLERAMKKYTEVLRTERPGETKLKAIALNYIRFVKEYPHLFKFIFCTEHQNEVNFFDNSMDENRAYIVEHIIKECGITDVKKAEDLYNKLGVFCHGLATMILFKSAIVTDSEVVRFIDEIYEAIADKVR
jgi:AcrR family transcriptional regulator